MEGNQPRSAGNLPPNYWDSFIEKALEVADAGNTAFGIKYNDGVILAGVKVTGNKMIELDTVDKAYKINDDVGVVYAGFMTDATDVVKYARIKAQQRWLQYGKDASVNDVTSDVCEYMHTYSSTAGIRSPFIRMIIGGYDTKPHLFEISIKGVNGGGESLATVIGQDSRDLTEFFEDSYRSGMDRQAAEDLAFEALSIIEEKSGVSQQGAKETIGLSAENIDFTVINAQGFESASKEYIAKALKTASTKRKK